MRDERTAVAQGRHSDWKDADTVGKDAVRGGVPRPQTNAGLDRSAANITVQDTVRVVPNSRLKWLLREACRAERMGQVEMGLDELRAVLAELEVRRG